MILREHIAFLCVLILCTLTHISSAGADSISAEQPRGEAFRTVLKKEASTINIPIELTSDELARILSQTVRKDLYKGSTQSRGLSADLVRNGLIAVSASDNFMYVTLPITMTLSYGMFETPAIPLKLKFRVTASVSPDWRLHTQIFYQGLSDLAAEEIGIGPVKIKPRSIVEGITQPVQKMMSDMVEQKINEQFPLKVQAAKVWNTAQKPILLDKNYNAWLNLTPREIVLYPLYAQNNRIRLSVGISTFADMVVGPEPAHQPVPPLPNLKLVNAFDKTFRIALNTDLYYKDLRALAATKLLDKRFDSDGKSVLIKGFDLYGNGDKLVIKLETEGSLDGVIYLTARPVFNPQTSVFSVEDVDFDMQTQSLLLKSADWFLHGTIRSRIQEKLNMDLTQRLEESRQMAGKALARLQLAERVFLKCDMKNLKFNDVVVQEDKFSIQVYAEGESAILFQ